MPSAREARRPSKTGPAALQASLKFSQTHPASSPIACSSGPLNTTGGAITLPSALMSKNIPTAAMTPLLHVQKSFVPSVAGSTEPQRSYHDRIANKHQLSVEDLITLRKRIIALRADYLELYWDFLKCHDEDHVNTKVFAKVGLSDARLDLRLLHRKIAIIMNELESENIPEAKSLEKVLSKSELKKKQNMIKHGIEKYHQACREYEDYRRRVLILRETLNSIDENRVKLVLCCSEMDALDQGVYIEPYPFEERRLRVKHSIADEARPHKRLALDQSNNPYKKKYLSNKRRRESSDVSEDADVPPPFMDGAPRKKPRIILHMPSKSSKRVTQPLSGLATENSMQLASRDSSLSSANPSGSNSQKPRITLRMGGPASLKPGMLESQKLEQNDGKETGVLPEQEVAITTKPKLRIKVKTTKEKSQDSPLMALKKLIDDLTDEAELEDKMSFA